MSKRPLHSGNGERDTTDNPIIAAVQRSLRGKQLVPVVDDWRSVPGHILRESVRFTFEGKALKEVGTIVCLALLTGDRRIIKTVKDALRHADHLFNRDREPVIVKHVMTYLPVLLKRGLDIAAIKKEIEKRSNHGVPLQQHRWNRLRRALHLPKLPVGRRRNPDTKRRQSVS